MKQIIAILVFIIIFVSLSFYINNYLYESSRSLTYHVSKIDSLIKNKNWKEAYSESIKLKGSWVKVEKPWSMLVEHQEIDAIESSMSRVEKYVQSKDYSQSLSENSNLQLLIRHIPKTYDFNLTNLL